MSITYKYVPSGSMVGGTRISSKKSVRTSKWSQNKVELRIASGQTSNSMHPRTTDNTVHDFVLEWSEDDETELDVHVNDPSAMTDETF